MCLNIYRKNVVTIRVNNLSIAGFQLMPRGWNYDKHKMNLNLNGMVSMWKMRELVDKATNIVMNYTEVEAKV